MWTMKEACGSVLKLLSLSRLAMVGVMQQSWQRSSCHRRRVLGLKIDASLQEALEVGGDVTSLTGQRFREQPDVPITNGKSERVRRSDSALVREVP